MLIYTFAMVDLSFRTYLVEREKVSGYVSTLDTDLDINPKAFRDQVFSASNLTLNGITYTGVTYKILSMNRDGGGKPSKGIIQIINVMGKAYRKDPDGKNVILPNTPPTAPMVMTGQELEKLITQGLDTPAAAPGTAPGAPPGMM